MSKRQFTCKTSCQNTTSYYSKITNNKRVFQLHRKCWYSWSCQ